MLDRALQSLVECKKPGSEIRWEVLVVDNASSDSTCSVANSFGSDLPVRLVHEEKLGLSNARNRAVREARGEWMLWTDDDVRVSNGWLVEYANAIHRHPDASVLGGPIEVLLEGSPPPWLDKGMRWILDAYAGRSDTDFSGAFHARGPKPYGANFALRRSAARQFPFDPQLGRHPLRPTAGGEELAVIAAVLANNGKGWWVPGAGVTHHIDSARQSIDYVRSYYVDAGRLSATRGRELRLASRLALLTNSLLRACANELQYRALSVLGERDHCVRRLRDAAWHWGYAKGYARGLGKISTKQLEERGSV